MTDPTVVPTNAQLAVAAAEALAPLAGPYGVVADNLLTAGLAYWSAYQAKKAAGTLTMGDLQDAAAKTSSDLSKLTADVAALS